MRGDIDNVGPAGYIALTKSVDAGTDDRTVRFDTDGKSFDIR